MATYKANRAEFARFMLDDRFGDVTEDVANRIAEKAREYAPEGATGDYKRSFRVETGLDLRKQDRRAARVINDSRQAAALEFGSYNIKNPPRPLRRALETFGE